jgi:hypothetical protein
VFLEGINSLKTEEKTTSVAQTMKEASLNFMMYLTDTTVHQQVCPSRIYKVDERLGKHSLERR